MRLHFPASRSALCLIGSICAGACAATDAVPAAGFRTFSLTSDSLLDGARLDDDQVYAGFGCEGGNLSPALSWGPVPPGTESLAVTIHDPDAQTGSGWWHWMVVNLPPGTAALPEGAGTTDGNALPDGARQLRNDFGETGFGGACPPPGDVPHRYVVTVHALGVPTLGLPEEPSAALAGFLIGANETGRATVVATYGR